MRRLIRSLLLVGMLLATAAVAAEGPPEPVRHALTVRLDPATHRLAVTDRITLPENMSPVFELNARLRITSATPAVEPLAGAGGRDSAVPVKRYRLKGSATALTLAYEGFVDFPLSEEKEEYTRGFRQTAGRVAPEGVFLSGSTRWYPQFGEELVRFTMEARAPDGWHLISQGNGTSRGTDGLAHWDSGSVMDEIYLVGGPLRRYAEDRPGMEALVYLHEPDQALADRYLAATTQYIEMYGRLIGPYPYAKFALVENFWETGYGMPTFTLLGPKVIRFPFILTSSYPHEILHNWWGNSVFVDYRTGNWCEGLTAYMADHLIQEQRGAGEEYRRSTLQKYRDYVSTGRDFPLRDFQERHSAASEAVGYGKALMLFHMARQHVGDEAFRQAVSRFYAEFRGKRATYADLRRVVEQVSRKPLGWLFGHMLERTGAPALAVGPVRTRERQGRWLTEGFLSQTQAEPPYPMEVPVVVQTAKASVTQRVRMISTQLTFAIVSDDRPIAVHVDPGFDVFRRLDPLETPPAIGQLFGEQRVVAVLPAEEDPARLAAYRTLVEGWRAESHQVDIRVDSELTDLPQDASVWLLGRDNRFAKTLFANQPGLALHAASADFDGSALPFADHTLALARRHPRAPDKAVGWIVADVPAALPGLGRKLPHYGRYSYVGFKGSEPANVLKGQWKNEPSPLRVDLRPQEQRNVPLPPLQGEPRKALADLPEKTDQRAR